MLRAVERIVFGGPMRERLLLRLLSLHFESIGRRQWRWVDPLRVPHFFDHRVGAFGFLNGGGTPFGYYRAYFAAELIRSGDRLLDIGCGDGFFTRRFFAALCTQVDAIDVDASAIAHARRHNAAANVAYTELDAVLDPFPGTRYDVVVWDGALGHFSREMTSGVLEKIAAALDQDGAFVGSESLGPEGNDHLQFFGSLDEIGALLAPHFNHVELRELAYDLPEGVRRREAFWRCALEPGRLRDAEWRGPARVGEPSAPNRLSLPGEVARGPVAGRPG